MTFSRSLGVIIKPHAAVLIPVLPLAVSMTAGQTTASQIPRMPDNKPNLTGLWQALGTAYWDIQDHSARRSDHRCPSVFSSTARSFPTQVLF